MDSGSPSIPANHLAVKSAPTRSDDPWLWRDHPTIGCDRVEENVRLRRQEATRGLRLINLERRANFFSFQS